MTIQNCCQTWDNRYKVSYVSCKIPKNFPHTVLFLLHYPQISGSKIHQTGSHGGSVSSHQFTIRGVFLKDFSIRTARVIRAHGSD